MSERLNELLLSNAEILLINKTFSKFMNYKYSDIEENKKLLNEIISEDILSVFKKIGESLKNNQYIVVKYFGTNLSALVNLVFFLSNGNIFKIPHLNEKSFISIFKMKNCKKLSHTLSDGFYHTDYSLHPNTPDFITLQIVERDPKYPNYSKSSIVLVDDIIKFLLKNDKSLLDFLINIKLPITNGRRTIFQSILNIEDKTLKFHYKLIYDAIEKDNKYKVYNNMLDQFISICDNLAIDFSLDKGDLAIISNKTILHKRGEASVKYNKSNNYYSGRVVNSIRYYK